MNNIAFSRHCSRDVYGQQPCRCRTLSFFLIHFLSLYLSRFSFYFNIKIILVFHLVLRILFSQLWEFHFSASSQLIKETQASIIEHLYTYFSWQVIFFLFVFVGAVTGMVVQGIEGWGGSRRVTRSGGRWGTSCVIAIVAIRCRR